MTNERSYIAIDLKSFYASVECVDAGLDPLTAKLVVADESRTDKTICLAVSPALKAYGIPGRPRLFEVKSAVKNAHIEDLVIAPPRMSRYVEVSTRIYNIYLKYIAPEDIHVYSVDEVFMDVTAYLKTYDKTPHELAVTIIHEVLDKTGITATCGIGTNLYLSKVAMDIVAKHTQADADGVRIAELDETRYRRLLWDHRPLTDFWRVGPGTAKKLEQYGMHTMGDVARCSLGGALEYHNEELLYKLFGVNAELLIDHAWGWEPCTIEAIKAYKPEYNSVGNGQVLQSPYTYEKGRLIVWEMTDLLVLDLVDKGLMTDQIVMTIGYDIENLKDTEKARAYKGETHLDRYGREVPKHAHGTANLKGFSSSTKEITDAVLKLYDEIIDKNLLIRRVYITANHVKDENAAVSETGYEQLDLFTDLDELNESRAEEERKLKKEKDIQHAVLDIKKKYGKNAILKGTNFVEGAMTRSRNAQIGGHKA